MFILLQLCWFVICLNGINLLWRDFLLKQRMQLVQYFLCAFNISIQVFSPTSQSYVLEFSGGSFLPLCLFGAQSLAGIERFRLDWLFWWKLCLLYLLLVLYLFFDIKFIIVLFNYRVAKFPQSRILMETLSLIVLNFIFIEISIFLNLFSLNLRIIIPILVISYKFILYKHYYY